MSQPTPEQVGTLDPDVSGPVDLNEAVHEDPFNGDSQQFEVDKALDLGRLQDEISHRVGVEVEVVLSYDKGMDHVSGDHPGVLFVHPGAVDKRAVTSVIATHRAQTFGEDAEPVQPAPTPVADVTSDPALSDILAKLDDGKTLTTADLTKVIGALLGVSTAQSGE